MRLSSHRHTIGVTRREFLQVGYSGLLGLTAAAAFGSAPAGPAGAADPGLRGGRAKSLILVFLTGGPSHLDTFDLKPDAPAEVRGEFKPIPTSVNGIRICEHLPGLAKRMERLAIIRSMTHKNNGHLPATHWLLTGHAMPGIPEDLGVDRIRSRSDWPCYSAGVGQLRPQTNGIPAGVNLPTYLQEPPLLWPGQYAGTLGPQYDPWQITDDPSKEGFRVENLSLPGGFTLDRLRSRQSLLQRVNQQQDRLGKVAASQALADQQKAAFTLLHSGGFAGAFQIEKEPPPLRDRYGRNMFGQSLLLARRLVESGVPVVQANMGRVQNWDTHSENWSKLKTRLLPPLDQAVSALLDDLHERGMLDQTLVVVVGEFGRTPKISTLAGQSTPGRDHWCDVFSAVFAGAGVRGGQVIGASDSTGGYPAGEGYTPDDLGATVYHSLGISPDAEFVDREGRPHRLCSGKVIQPLF